MIKYLGSKRTLVPVLGTIASAVQARTAVDLFTGTTRVAQEFKRRGCYVTATDLATYSQVLGECYISTDADTTDLAELGAAIDELQALPGTRGYVTHTFCEDARFFQPANGERIDAIRDAIEERWAGHRFYPILLTSLLLAADRVDSTTGLQMAYLKQWAPRASRPLELTLPELIAGPGHTIRGDVTALVDDLPPVDLAYVDPPYNQHRYYSNYHVWETLVRWDAPEHYGVACKRVDNRADTSRSAFNVKKQMPSALADVLMRLRAETVVVSYNDESWVTADQMTRTLHEAGHDEVQLLEFDARRYVGARIGIYNAAGHKAGTVSHTRNTEYVFVAGRREAVMGAIDAVRTHEVGGAAGLRPHG